MTQNAPTPQWKSLIGCLGRRVLSISFLLLVIPLLIHTFLLYKEARHHAQIDNLNNLAVLARTEAAYIRLLVSQNIADIKTIEILGQYQQKTLHEQDSVTFSKIAYEQSLTSLFLAEKMRAGTWSILSAARPERLDGHDLDPDEYDKILNLGTAVYLYKDELVGKKELRIGYALGNNKIMITGMPLEGVAAALVRAPTLKARPCVAFSTSDTDLYYATVPSFELSNCRLFAPEELIDVDQQPSSNFKLSMSDQFVGVKIPVTGNSFYLVIALSKDQFLDSSSQTGLNHILQLTLLFVLIGGGGVLFLTARIARPLKQLFGCFDQVSKGDLTACYVNDSVGFELNVLGQKFNQMLASLELNIEEVKKQKLAKELLKQELSIGHDIQKAILKTSLREVGPFVFTTAFIPAMEVSGDYYDVYKIDETRVLLVVADTSGKGISACLYSLGARSVLRALTKSGLSLDKILIQMNELILEDVETQGAFITAFIGILDISTHSLVYTSCGHPPAYLLTKQGIRVLPSKGMALGAHNDFKFDLQTIHLEPHDKVFIYTDGVTEAHNPTQQMYTQNRLEAFLEAQKNHTSSAIIDNLQKDVEAFCHKAELHDDITLLCIEKRS